MPQHAPQPVPLVLRAFVALAGQGKWHARLRDLGRIAPAGSLAARAAQQRHALELILARLADPAVIARAGLPERRILALAQEAAELARILDPGPRERLRSLVAKGLEGQGTLVPLFHLIRTASILRSRGFTVRHDGILDGASYDLLAQRDHCVAEVVCETISAEEGRPLHKGDWVQLVDRVNPELQTWLAAHPGRYILKMTLPEEVPAGGSETGRIAGLHARITAMLSAQKRQDSSADAMLKLDPLVLAGAQAASDPGRALPARLREVFGVEAHLAVTADPQSGSVLVMAARAGRENEIAQAMKRRPRPGCDGAPQRQAPRHPRGLPGGPGGGRVAQPAHHPGAGGRHAPLPDRGGGAPCRRRHLRHPAGAVRPPRRRAGGRSALPQPCPSGGAVAGAGAGHRQLRLMRPSLPRPA
jgi:hypothetical protein